MTFMHSVPPPRGDRGGMEAFDSAALSTFLCPVPDLLAEALASLFFSSLSNKSARGSQQSP